MAQEGQRQLGMNRETAIAVTILCALAGVPLVIAGLVHLSGLHQPTSGLALIGLGSLFLLGGWYSWRRPAHPAIEVLDDGLVVYRWGRPRLYRWQDIARVSVNAAGAVTAIRLELDRCTYQGRRSIALGYVDGGEFRAVVNEMQRTSAGARSPEPTRWQIP